jgi:hypothetical protein
MTMSDGLWARAMNLLLGGWLFISAFAWEHTGAERVSTAYVGFLAFAAALVAVSIPKARRFTTALSLWLLASPLVLPTLHAGTRWNNALVALAMLGLSLVGPRDEPRMALPRQAS